AERIGLGSDVSLSRSDVAREHVDLHRDGIAPVADAGGRTAGVVAVGIGRVHGRRPGGRHGGVEAVLELQVFHAFDQRHDVEGVGTQSVDTQFRALQRGDAVARLVVVGDEVDVSTVLVQGRYGDAILQVQSEACEVGVECEVGAGAGLCGAARGLEVDVSGHLRI